jgi:antitoxin (DNA-binding transcriptional repressor) of toxin-antitoxin stability system
MSQKTFEITQLSDKLIDLLSDLQIGTEVLLTRQGVPLAKVMPLSTKQPVTPKVGLNDGAMVMSDDFDEPLPDESILKMGNQSNG